MVVAGFLLIAHHEAYAYSIRIAQRFTEQVLSDALTEEAKENNGPVQTTSAIL